VADRQGALSAAGDPLERLPAVVEFELFRAELTRRSSARTAPGPAAVPMRR
jgi:hypothetical protein